ncbi:hypothetical protein DSO57_1007460 [Entomophthora muscae]|uniref:Uncharacterized protein n=1 Tax=Entomophthora muscae TaxID=34485 RepID=A0ACC2SW89_9FUNG|nr:hypothetical protein DSO57_1007460 [Entomophthora muscae]
MTTPPSWSLTMTQDTLWGLVTRNPTRRAAFKPSPKPSPKPSFEQSPAHSTGGEKSDSFLTDHSFYNLASDEDPTKKQCQAQKTPPKDKSPTHEERHNKSPSSPLAKLSSF